MPREREKFPVQRIWRRMTARLAVAAMLLVLGAAAMVTVRGVRGRLLDFVLGRLSGGTFAFDAAEMRVAGLDTLVIVDARMFRKRVAGPPAATAGRVSVRIRPWALLRGQWALREVVVENGLFRSRQAMDRRGEPRTTEPARRRRTGTFHLSVFGARADGVDVDQFHCLVEVEPAGTRLQQMQAVVRYGGMRGGAEGSLRYDPVTRVLEGRVVSRLHPHALVPLLEQHELVGLGELVERFGFGDEMPHCEATFRRTCTPEGDMTALARVWMQEARYRGVEVLRSDADIAVEFRGSNRTVRLAPLLVVRQEGLGRGEFTVDLQRRRVTFDAVSAMDPRALTDMIGIMTNGWLQAVEFRGPVNVAAHGMCDYGDMRHTDVAAVVHARDVSWRGLAADTCSMRMRMQGGSNRVEDIRADICGGSVTGSVEVVRDLEGARPPAYRVALRADALDFEALAKLWAPRDEGHRGRFTATLDLGGTVGSEAAGTARGHGFLSVREGRVFALPLFGGLSRILSRVVPGLDFVLRQSDAEAAFTVAGGVVRSEKISVKGDVLSLSGHGEYRFERRELDFHAQVHLMKEHTLVAKLLRVITYPLSKLFEFRVRGTLEEPAWYPVNFSKELLEKIRSGNAP